MDSFAWFVWLLVFFFKTRVNSVNSLEMINTDVLPQLLQHFEMHERGTFRHLWVQDGTRGITACLRELFGNRVIALHHAVEWPPRSPDLTPCDFFLWGHLKSKVYTSPLVIFVRKLLFWQTIRRWFDKQFKASFDAVNDTKLFIP